MEALTLAEKIADFLQVSYGDGSGYGDGYGDGSGYGYGDSSGVKSFCGEPVRMVDGVATIIRVVRGSIARGLILNGDLTTSPCYVVRQDNILPTAGACGRPWRR